MQLAWTPDPEDLAFEAVYGAWDRLTPAQAAELLAGFVWPWWVVGGWAIEAFTGVRRAHEDVDVAMFADDVPALVPFAAGRLHLWSNDGGTFRVLDADRPEPLAPLAQVWVRRDAASPWLLDISPNPGPGTAPRPRWVDRRDPSITADWDEVTWVADDGIRYLRPELVLLAKSRLRRVKDEVDLASAWPLLDEASRAWLRDRIVAADPGHPWLPRLPAHDEPVDMSGS